MPFAHFASVYFANIGPEASVFGRKETCAIKGRVAPEKKRAYGNVYYIRNFNTKQLLTINISKFISAKSYEKAAEDVDFKNIRFDPGAHAHNLNLEYALEHPVIVLYVCPGEALNSSSQDICSH